MTFLELFRTIDEKCDICRTVIKDGSVEIRGKSFCSIECMQEYLIRLKETDIMKTRNETRQKKFFAQQK